MNLEPDLHPVVQLGRFGIDPPHSETSVTRRHRSMAAEPAVASLGSTGSTTRSIRYTVWLLLRRRQVHCLIAGGFRDHSATMPSPLDATGSLS